MRTRDGGHSAPHDSAGFFRLRNGEFSEGEALDMLGIKMNLAMFLAREAFQQFRESALRAVTPVNEW